jgi:hypothetical protein
MWDTLLAITFLQSLLLLHHQLISRLQHEFMKILRTITTEQMGRIVVTLSRKDPS